MILKSDHFYNMNKKYILVWESGMTEVVKYHPNMFKGLVGPIEGDRRVWKGDGYIIIE